MGKIFYMMGKSSSGKDTIFKEILKKKELNLHQIVLYTTRPARANETDGVQYHFVDEERLSEFQDAGIIMGQNELCRFMSRLRTGCVWQGPWIGNAVR